MAQGSLLPQGLEIDPWADEVAHRGSQHDVGDVAQEDGVAWLVGEGFLHQLQGTVQRRPLAAGMEQQLVCQGGVVQCGRTLRFLAVNRQGLAKETRGLLVLTFTQGLFAVGLGQRGFRLPRGWVRPLQPGDLVIKILISDRPQQGRLLPLLQGSLPLLIGFFGQLTRLVFRAQLAQEPGHRDQQVEFAPPSARISSNSLPPFRLAAEPVIDLPQGEAVLGGLPGLAADGQESFLGPLQLGLACLGFF